MPQPILDLSDIQGNILLGYGYPFARYFFCEVEDSLKARRSLAEMLPHVTNSEWWRDQKPDRTLNISLSFAGLHKLEVPAETLAAMPSEFQEGMLARSTNLNHVRKNAPENWDDIWREGRTHVLLSINALSGEIREEFSHQLQQIIEHHRGLRVLKAQDGAALVVDGVTTSKEHFGYTDGIGNPDVQGSGIPPRPGRGNPVQSGQWDPVRTGEFLLGYEDEGGAVPAAPEPHLFSRNGSFLVYLKLHQNVAAFRSFLDTQAQRYPGGKDLLKAKLVGRWDDGTPLALCPYQKNAELAADPMRNNDFGYENDPDGARVPLGAHLRRMNPRDTFGFEGRLTCRHRIARRGLPYGDWVPYDQVANDQDERGVNFMVVNASIRRQFEFVWREWANYGNDFGLGNDRDPLIGNHTGHGSMVIPGDPQNLDQQPTCALANIPQFVELRGGGYFFLPSLTALRMIVEGSVIEHLSTYDPASIPVERVPLPKFSEPKFPPQPAVAEIETFWQWLAGLPMALVAPLVAAAKAWGAKHPLSVFWLLRTFLPVLVRGNLCMVSRYADVLDVLSRKNVFHVTYGDNMRRLTAGGQFFLGMQPSPEYDQDISNVRAATRRSDMQDIVAPTVAAAAQAIVQQSQGRLDVVKQLGLIVPTRLTAAYLGITTENELRFAEQASMMFRYLFIPDNPAEIVDQALGYAAEFRQDIDRIIRLRHQATSGADDMLERCLQLQRDGRPRMDDVQIRNNLMGLLIGMIPTTSKCVAQVLDQLLNRPQELAQAQRAARADNDQLLAKIVFEALRFNPQNPGLLRVVAEDCQLSGKRLARGTNVLALTWSAMFDDRVLASPGEFKLDRPAEHYLHFGYGMHTCFGEHISKIQIPGILKPLLQQAKLRRAKGAPGLLQMAGPFPSSLVVEFELPACPVPLTKQ